MHHHHPSRPPRDDPKPKNISDFVKRINNVNTPCTCDMHAPELYTNCRRLHHPLADMNALKKMPTIKPALRPAYCKPEALTLARAAIASFSVSEDEMTPTQQEALSRFRALKLNKFGWQHGGKALAAADVENVLRIFNELFFFGAVNFWFTWKDLNDSEHEAQGMRAVGFCTPDGHIRLDHKFAG